MADDTKKLLLQIDATTELLRRNLATGDGAIARFEADTKRRLSSIDRTFSTLGRGVDTVRGRFESFRGTLAAIGIAFGIHEIAEFTRRSFEMGSALAESAQQLGITARALQIYRYIGGQVGIEQETMDRSLAKLNRTLGQAALGAAAPTRALRAFGFSLAEIRQGLTVEAVIPRLADGLSRVESSSRRAAVEALFFGRTGQQLDNMLAGGSGRINELATAAERMGLILSDEQINRLDEAHDRYEALKAVLSAQIASLVADNSDAILGLVSALAELIRYARMAGDGWRNFRLELEAAQLQNQLAAQDTDPAWGMGGGGPPQTPRERLSTRLGILQRLSDVRNEQFQIAQRQDPNYHPPAPPVTPRRPARPQPPSLDNLEGDHTPSTHRTDAQAFHDFVSALAGLGIHPNRGRSGYRTFRDQQQIFAAEGPGNAAPPGTSDHEFYRALDLPANVDMGKVLQAARAAGINGLRQLVHGRARHSHISWSGHGQRGEGEATAGGEQQSVQEEQQFQSEMSRARITTLNAQRDLSTDYSERATLSARILDEERTQEFRSIDLSVQMGQRTEAQAKQLKAEFDTADALRRQQLIVEEQNQRREEYERLQAVSLELQRGALQGEADLATTAAERRRVELRILDLAYQEERDRLNRIIALGRGDADEEEARRRVAALPGQHRQQVAQTIAQTRGPLEQFFFDIPHTADQMNEALQTVAVDGAGALNTALGETATRFLHLGGIAGSVLNTILGDLIQIALRQAELAAFGGGGGGGGGSSFSSVIASVGSIISKSIGGGKAMGGDVYPGNIYPVGERGIELFQPKVPGKIIPNHALRSGAGGGTSHIVLELSPEIDARIVRVAGPVAVHVVKTAAPSIEQGAAARTINALQRPELA